MRENSDIGTAYESCELMHLADIVSLLAFLEWQYAAVVFMSIYCPAKTVSGRQPSRPRRNYLAALGEFM